MLARCRLLCSNVSRIAVDTAWLGLRRVTKGCTILHSVLGLDLQFFLQDLNRAADAQQGLVQPDLRFLAMQGPSVRVSCRSVLPM